MGSRVEDRRAAMRAADASGIVADSMEVRKALIARFESGEITFEAMQAELAAIKRGAKASGKITRNESFLRG